MKKTTIRFSDFLFIITTFFLLFLSFLSYNRIAKLNEAAEWVNHSTTVKLRLNQCLTNLVDAESSQRGYLLSKRQAFLVTYKDALDRMQRNFTRLDSLLNDNPEQFKNLDKLKQLTSERTRMLEYVLGQSDSVAHPSDYFIEWFEKGRVAMDTARNFVRYMTQQENKLLDKRIEQKNQTEAVTPLYSLFFSVVAVCLVVIFYLRLRKQTILRFSAQESEAKFRLLANSMPQQVWTTDETGRLNYFNETAFDFTGISQKELDSFDWFENIHPDDLEENTRRWKLSLSTGKEFYSEHRFKNRQGEYRWHLSRALSQKNEAGKIIMWIGTSTDIQDQKNVSRQLEQKVKERTEQLNYLNNELQMQNSIFAHAEEIASMGSYKVNINSGEMRYSDNLFRLFGCEPGEFVPTFDKFVSFVHPEDRDQVIKDGRETFEQKRLVEHVYRIVTKKGEIKYCRSTGNFIEEQGKTILIGSVQDISKDISLNESLQSKNLELERSNAELASFSYIASHDLQEPLRKIQLFANRILEEQTLNENSKNYFTRIISASTRMQRLIDALLSYSRANTSDIAMEVVELNKLVDEVKDNLHEFIEEKKGSIVVGSLPVVKVITIQFLQLLTNLINNAFKYSKKDVPPVVHIEAKVVGRETIQTDILLPETKYWEISIQDNGIGFEQQYENKIFELFQRLHGRSEYEGTGIGLAICKKIMHNHHGLITAVGKPGEGSTFFLYLPVTL